MKPVGWPRYMIEKQLKGGSTAYYWNVPNRDIAAGFTLGREALGPSYAEATERARILNLHLDAWRDGTGTEKIDEAQPGYGTLGWLFEQYRRHPLFEKKVSARAKGGYERALRAIEDMPTKLRHPAAHLPLTSISRRAVYKIYRALLDQGPRKADRATQAGYAINIARRAWNIVQPEHPKVVPTGNPWAKVERIGRKGTKPAATRVEAYALAHALKEIGEPHLGAAALIAFEWHQRPENMLAGSITWPDYRGADHSHHVRIVHKKNGQEVMLPLEDDDGQPFYPELEAYLAELPRLGLPIVLTSGERGPSRPYSMVYAQRRVREARKRAELGPHVTLDACRHGGLTEAADAGGTEQQLRALSGHKTGQALRVYLKVTEVQRTVASRQRRAHVDANKARAVVRIGRQKVSQNAGGERT